MDLIERYLQAVGRHLPRKNQADILAELRSTLVDALEAREGGKASEEQVVALLKEFGRPEKVAGSYWPEGQYLIGPRLYPLFRMVASISLTVFIIVQLVLLGVRLAFEQGPLPGTNFFGGLVSGALTAFGAVALVFAALERLGVLPECEDEDWDPRQLPVIEEANVVNQGGTVAEITMSLIFIAVLIFLPDKIGAVIGLGTPGTDVIINPVFTSYLPLIVLVILLGIGLDVVLLWRGRWETATRLAKIGTNLFSIYVLYVLIAAHNAWLSEHGISGFFSFPGSLPAGVTPSMDTVQVIVMQAFRLAFIVALIVTAVDTVNMGYRLLKRLISETSTPMLPNAKA
jgi:hypothetical protein